MTVCVTVGLLLRKRSKFAKIYLSFVSFSSNNVPSLTFCMSFQSFFFLMLYIVMLKTVIKLAFYAQSTGMVVSGWCLKTERKLITVFAGAVFSGDYRLFWCYRCSLKLGVHVSVSKGAIICITPAVGIWLKWSTVYVCASYQGITGPFLVSWIIQDTRQTLLIHCGNYMVCRKA